MRCEAKMNITYSIEYVNQCFIDQERLEENRDDGCTFAKYQEGGVHPREGFPIKYRKECDLGEVCP